MAGERSVASAVPVIRWHGWRPVPLDMTESEQSGQIFLVLGREGDLVLLPTATLSYLCYAPLGEGDRWQDHGIDPVRVSYSDAVARCVVMRTVNELTAEGWQVVGRPQATFCGVDTEDDFGERLDCAGSAADKETRS